MKLYYLQCKQFQLVDSMLFGQVRLAVFSDAVTIFLPKDGSAVLEELSCSPLCLSEKNSGKPKKQDIL